MSSLPEELLNKNSITEQVIDETPTTPTVTIEDMYIRVDDFSDEAIEYKIEDYGQEEENNNTKAYVVVASNAVISLEKNHPVYIYKKETDMELLGIVINALGTDSIYPRRSISILDVMNPHNTPKLIMGYLPENISNDFGSKINGTYGLYCDNVALRGSIISKTDKTIAGISTNDFFSPIE